MNKKWTGALILAAFLVLGAGGYYLGAQMGVGMNNQRQGQRPGMNRPMGMMAGGAAMIAFERNIYVLMGPTLMKIDPATMKVVKELTLKQAPGRGNAQDMPDDMPMGE